MACNKLVSLSLAMTILSTTLTLPLQVHGWPLPPPPPSSGGSCPMNALKLAVCANVLNLLKLNIPVGKNDQDQCCPLLEGLVDLDAALCLCTAIKANILGINIDVPVDLSLLLNHCGKICPADFTCPA